jgi:hypothetical protein
MGPLNFTVSLGACLTRKPQNSGWPRAHDDRCMNVAPAFTQLPHAPRRAAPPIPKSSCIMMGAENGSCPTLGAAVHGARKAALIWFGLNMYNFAPAPASLA